MAMNLGGGGRGGRGRYRPMAEINVTPMVDVMLVLLIIFMITAPLMTSGVNVDLPKTNASPVQAETEPLTVSIASDSKVYLGDTAMDLPDLVAKLQAAAQNNPDRRIFVRGDKDVPYGRIIEVMGTITQGGFTKVALLAEQTGGSATPGGAGPGAAAPTVRGGTAPASTQGGVAPSGAANAPARRR